MKFSNEPPVTITDDPAYASLQYILIVDDDPVVRAVLHQHLSVPGRRLLFAASGAEARLTLADYAVDLVILDLSLPDTNGRTLLAEFRRQFPTVPIIILSHDADESVQADCYALGADTCFIKPFNPTLLSTVITSKLLRAEEASRLSTSDPLTGFPNREAFRRAFSQAARVAMRGQEPLAVAMVDLDRFKSVNDLYGHPMGDEVLIRCSRAIAASLRASDFFARWGGEEFAIFFPKTTVQQAKIALSKAQEAVARELFQPPEAQEFHMTFSAGVAITQQAMTAEEALADADRYLYLAKAAGRNRVLTDEDNVVAPEHTILLVEDDDFTATVLKKHLQREGFSITHAKEGRFALEAVGQRAFSLITLDVRIPDGDGFQLLSEIRRLPVSAKTPVIMLTALGREADIIRGFQLGADDYISKPFSPAELVARMRRLLRS